MSAVRREYLDQLNTDADIIPLAPRSGLPAALRSILNAPKEKPNTDIEDALNIVKKAAHTIDTLIARNKEIESGAAATIDQYKSEAIIAQSKFANLCSQFKKFINDAKAEAVIANTRISTLEAQTKLLNRELETAQSHNKSLLHFRSQVIVLLADASAKLEESQGSSDNSSEYHASPVPVIDGYSSLSNEVEATDAVKLH